MMNKPIGILLLVCVSLLVAGCRSPKLVSRPLTNVEAGWASSIQRSYPTWKPPFIMPDRNHWEPRPISQADLLPMLEGEASPAIVPSPTILPPAEAPETAVAPVAVSAEPGETVVEITVPAADEAPAPAAPVVPAAPAEPKVVPAKVVSEPDIDDVEFVPAESAK